MEKLSVIVPVYNEEKVLEDFFNRMTVVMDKLDMDSEVIFVNDGSQDNSLNLIRSFSLKDSRVAFINLSRNFGKEAAMSAGLDFAEGDAVVIIDADLQDPPELIPEMISLWRQGYDNVYGQRIDRHGESKTKRATAYLFYRVIQRIGRFRIPKDAGDFRLLSRRAVLALRRLPENNRFMKGLFAWIGYSGIAVKYCRDIRYGGHTKFNYWKLWNFALDGIASFTTLPLKLSSYVGLFIAIFSFAYGFYIVIRTLIFGDPVAGFPTIITVILFLGGIQLLFLGIFGEYLGRMYDETKSRPIYLIEEIHGVTNPECFRCNSFKKTKKYPLI